MKTEFGGSWSESETQILKQHLVKLLEIGGQPQYYKDGSRQESRLEEAKNTLITVLNKYLNQILCFSERRGSLNAVTIKNTESNEFKYRVVVREKVKVNFAASSELVKLKGIGPSLAKKLINYRLQNGPIFGGDDLQKIEGIGPQKRQILEKMLDFSTIIKPHIIISNKIADASGIGRFHDYVLLLYGDKEDHQKHCQMFLSELSKVIMMFIKDQRPRRDEFYIDLSSPALDLADREWYHSDWISLLLDTNYYYTLRNILSLAKKSIDVCMFHISFEETKKHPSIFLLEALVSALHKGVNVRVLLDMDREEDPYRSRVINTPAFNFLSKAGVSVKFDLPESLLHSKFIVIDRQLVVIGSHNWTAGSYFHYKDSSVLVKSSHIGKLMTERFEKLWELAG